SQFATWCALVNEHGLNWREWPVELRRPSSPEVAKFAVDHVGDIVFFSWLQWVADEQLRDAQSAAKAAGMRVGIMNDLAVGVSGHSAEAWMLGDTFARGVSVGAPPDHFNQTGQDWGQAPWRPDRLADLSYAPFRNMVAGILRHSGGIRVDHIMGLFRLWWVPRGLPPTKGTYVRYNHEAMVGILVLEAQRAGAVVVGEDLGVVEPWVRDYLRDRGILGTSIAWFERGGDGQILPPESWREYCMASVTTHDLPPTAGYLDAAHVKLQHALGLLTEDLDVELAGAAREREDWLRVLRERGFLTGANPTTEDVVLAMHRFLVATPARMLCAALTDAVGDHRTQNQPGTTDEYPNWRVPLSGPDGEPMSLEDVFHSEHALRLSAVMNGFVVPPTAHRSTSDFIIGTD
ncbi:MAG TPA: 4-alpha-glucanotransferase, partial [Micropruina sp.]|nr:4-alpha-glucanotransferase [Micropruina sp.]HMR21416.1 4-alpha-glucanotransferase [Micropruina sp.]